ncbi:MAG: glycosyltransferase [Desulfatitalea sp.]
MRLLVLTTSYPSSTYPHSGVFVRRMLERLPEDIQITVLTPGLDRTVFFESDKKRIVTHAFRYAPRAWQTLAHGPGGLPVALRNRPWQWALVPFFCMAMLWNTICLARRVDLIHAHWSVCGVIAGLAGRLMGVPVVTTLRGEDVTKAEAGLLYQAVIRWCGVLNDQIVTVGQTMADRVGRWLSAKAARVTVVANGAGGWFGTMASRADDQGFTLAVIGNLIPRKKVDSVVRALAILAGHTLSIRLFIVGEGPERAPLEALTGRLGLAGQVVFTGSLAPERVQDLLVRCHAMVLASRSEGRPNVVLEAMAAGVPVVAGDIAGVRELIAHQERGLLFPAGDERRLAAHLRSLMDDPALGRRLAANARQWLDDQGLTWENTARRYADIYRQVLRRQIIRRQVLRQRRDRN